MEQFEDEPNVSKAEQLIENLLYILINMDPRYLIITLYPRWHLSKPVPVFSA